MAGRILTVVGARPQFIKAATISRVLKARTDISEVLVHTGQHHDDSMSAVFFEQLEIPEPKHHLGISGGGHGDMTGRMLIALEQTMTAEMPDAVLLYGDTNSTLSGAIAAAKLQIPIVHVEAGVRCYNRNVPEEVNRVLIDHVSTLLLCPTSQAVENLRKEAIASGVHAVGDVMFDAMRHATGVGSADSRIIEELDLNESTFALCTLHRAETTDNEETLARAIEFLEAQARKQPIVFPVHPRTKKALKAASLALRGVREIPPVGYFDMQALLARCSLVITDSGGLQKEAYFHRKLCITLRDETEWTETVDAGWNRLWNQASWKEPRTEISDFGDGRAAEKCVDHIAALLN